MWSCIVFLGWLKILRCCICLPSRCRCMAAEAMTCHFWSTLLMGSDGPDREFRKPWSCNLCMDSMHLNDVFEPDLFVAWFLDHRPLPVGVAVGNTIRVLLASARSSGSNSPLLTNVWRGMLEGFVVTWSWSHGKLIFLIISICSHTSYQET
jgi:hypothetical protein